MRRASLEAKLPAVVEGIAMRRSSSAGAPWVRHNAGSRAFLRRLGRDPDHIGVAYAFPAAPPQAFGAVAYQVDGADSERLLDEFKRYIAPPSGMSWTTEEVNGQQVTVGTSEEWGPNGTMYLWTVDDILFQVVHPDRSVAAGYMSSIAELARQNDA